MKVSPKKSLGQHFLVDKNILKQIVDLGNINNRDIVIEVVPGTGNLTEYILLKNPKKLITIMARIIGIPCSNLLPTYLEIFEDLFILHAYCQILANYKKP